MVSETRPVSLNFPATSQVIGAFSGCILWHASIETTGAATAEYQLWDGYNNQGPLLMDVGLSAGQSTRDYIHKHHLVFRVGLFYVPVSGSVRGTVSVLVGCRCGHGWPTIEYQPTVIQVDAMPAG